MRRGAEPCRKVVTMGRGRSKIYGAARNIVGQYSLSEISDSRGKIVDFYKWIDENGGIRVADGKIKITKDASARAGDLATELSDRMVMKDYQAEQDFKEIKAEFSGSYSISKRDAANIPDFNRYKRSSDNYVRINDKGMSIDTKYQELAEKYPHYFSTSVTNPAEQLQTINTVLGDLKNSTRKMPKEWRRSAIPDLKGDIIRGYIAAKGRKRA